jgi:hypothetical protein
MTRTHVDPGIDQAARKIAVECRHIIQSLLRDEEIHDCDLEFYRVAREILEEMARNQHPS